MGLLQRVLGPRAEVPADLEVNAAPGQVLAPVGGKAVLKIAVLVLGLAVCYAFGTAWFVVAYAKTAGPISWAAALGKCVLPFVIPDLVKLALAALLRARVAKYLPAAA